MAHVSLPRTTHTLELSQLADLNSRLSQSEVSITASELGLGEARALVTRRDGALPGSAVLQRLCCEGPPEFPYVHAHFESIDQNWIVDLHTPALRELSRRLGVRQHWGG